VRILPRLASKSRLSHESFGLQEEVLQMFCTRERCKV